MFVRYAPRKFTRATKFKFEFEMKKNAKLNGLLPDTTHKGRIIIVNSSNSSLTEEIRFRQYK